VSIVVSDTSPIRALAHIGHLDLLASLFGEVVIPPAVAAELERPRSRFVPIDINELPYVQVQAPKNRSGVTELLAILDPGEAEALVLATEIHADAILIDEAAGRTIARQRGLMPLGVLGMLLRAKQKGYVTAISPLLDRLQKELGFFISPEIRSDVLKQANE